MINQWIKAEQKHRAVINLIHDAIDRNVQNDHVNWSLVLLMDKIRNEGLY